MNKYNYLSNSAFCHINVCYVNALTLIAFANTFYILSLKLITFIYQNSKRRCWTHKNKTVWPSFTFRHSGQRSRIPHQPSLWMTQTYTHSCPVSQHLSVIHEIKFRQQTTRSSSATQTNRKRDDRQREREME